MRIGRAAGSLAMPEKPAADAIMGDRYNREARVVPALLSLAPVVISLFIWVPPLRDFVPGLVTFIGFFGGLIWLSYLSRPRAHRAQNLIFGNRARLPTTLMLRHDGAALANNAACAEYALNGKQKDEYKKLFQELNQELTFPSQDEERQDPTAADVQYEFATEWLREVTRDAKRFPLVIEENISYGFHLTFFALRDIALRSAAFSFIAGVAATLLASALKSFAVPPPEQIIALVLLAGYWSLVNSTVTAKKVEIAGCIYAQQLFKSLHVLKMAARRPPDAGDS